MNSTRYLVLLLLIGSLSLGCDKTVESSADGLTADTANGGTDVLTEPEATPKPPILAKLTQAQYRNTVRDLFGEDVVVPGGLEPDTESDGLYAVGASIASVSPLGAERYADSARSIASQIVESTEILASVTDCSPDTQDVGPCLKTMVETLGKNIWRRPVTASENAALVALGQQAKDTLGSYKDGVEYVISAMLQSPYFLYRVTFGEASEEDTGLRRYSNWELASRLSYFLWNTLPDSDLMEAAANGELLDEGLLEVQVDRMLADPRARQGVRNFFADWLGLFGLDDLKKDPNIFKHYAPELGSMAREETLRVAEDIVFERQADMREFLTTRRTFVTGRLAAIYNVPATTSEGFGQVDLPPEGDRVGFLGQVSFLAAHAHPVSTSPTQRGVFVREKLLCQTVPSPPADVNTAIPEVSDEAQSFKQRLMVHMEDPSCAPCHAFIDPIGFGLENFDGVGRYRILDNGIPIDPTGNLDEQDFDGPVSLAKALSEHPDYARCIVTKVFSYAMGRHAASDEYALLTYMTSEFNTDERRLLNLFKAIAMNEAFRLVGEVVK
jgi:hypothetical protein